MAKSDRTPGAVRALTTLFLLGTFAAGIAAGVGVTLWITSSLRPPGPPPMLLRKLPLEELSLSRDQWDEVRDIVEGHRPSLEAIVEETFPRVSKINDEIDAEIMKILTEDQRKQLREIQKKRKERDAEGPGRRGHGHRWREGGGPFGGPRFGPGHKPGDGRRGPPPFHGSAPPPRGPDAGPHAQIPR